jgi:hypothetical protein
MGYCITGTSRKQSQAGAFGSMSGQTVGLLSDIIKIIVNQLQNMFSIIMGEIIHLVNL